MQKLQDLQEKIFSEAKDILDTLSKIETKEELLAKHGLISEVSERISFLRLSEKYEDSFVVEFAEESNKSEIILRTEEPEENFHFEDSTFEEDVLEEEIIFSREEIGHENKENFGQISTENLDDNAEKKDLAEEDIVAEEEILSQKEKEFLEMEERRRKIVEFNRKDLAEANTEEHFSDNHPQEHSGEKKFKLANIKGLKAVQNLFDEDPLAEIENKPEENSDLALDSGSLLKSNMATEFMEAPKKNPEFRLDLNDKVAFTKLLFNGDENELKLTIDKLNSFDSLDDAKQYLSEIYYSKDWKNADDYAQRLWNLVESKF